MRWAAAWGSYVKRRGTIDNRRCVEFPFRRAGSDEFFPPLWYLRGDWLDVGGFDWSGVRATLHWQGGELLPLQCDGAVAM